MIARPTPPRGTAITREPANAVTIHLLEAAAADEHGLVNRLTALVNGVHAAAEAGMWRTEAKRTTAAELAEHVRGREIAVARAGEEVLGSVRIWDVGDGRSEFGLLATAPEHRGRGIGSALVRFAQRHTNGRGRRAMRLELLVPRGSTHPEKQKLDAWYRRIGYRGEHRQRRQRLSTAVPLLCTPCDFVVYEKPLTAAPPRAKTDVSNTTQ